MELLKLLTIAENIMTNIRRKQRKNILITNKKDRITLIIQGVKKIIENEDEEGKKKR